MAEFFLLGLEVLFGVRTGLDYAWHTLHNFHTGVLQRLDLVGIIRKQPHSSYAERFEYLPGQTKVALICFKAQPLIGFHGVEPRILQLIGL